MTRMMQIEPTSWQPVRELALAAQTDVPVMVTARSRQQRRLFARYIHDSGVRHSQPFVPVSFSVTAQDEEWFASPLTSAVPPSEIVSTWFQQAEGGTLFLDDLERMSEAVQQRLCAALCYSLDTRRDPHQVRIISGTRPTWPTASERQRFSDSLYYRLNVIRVDCGEQPHRQVARERQGQSLPLGAVVDSWWSAARVRAPRGR
jgi:DNA-binding NtrC family response regulator